MRTVDIDQLLRNDELLQLLETAEQAGSLKAAELTEVVETHELDPLELDGVYRELDRRGVEVLLVGGAGGPASDEEEPEPLFAAVRRRRPDARTLPREAAVTAADRRRGGGARRNDRARRRRLRAAHDRVELAGLGGLHREDQPQPGLLILDLIEEGRPWAIWA